jgi:iron complex outermembrane receptor protein
MTYISYSRGFKAGGINLDRSAGGGVANNPAITPGATPLNPVYQPEFIDGFEAGLKSEYFDQRVRTNVALFYDRITDLQVAQFLGLNYQVVNVPTAQVAGAELESTARLNDDLTLNGALTLLPEANFGSSPLIAENLHNRRFSQAAREAGNIGIDLNHPVSDHYALIGNITEQVTSRVYIDTVTNTSQGVVPLLNANFGVKSLDHGWTLEAWCLNCTDKRYLSTAFGGPLQTGTELAFISPPLTFGVRLRGTF